MCLQIEEIVYRSPDPVKKRRQFFRNSKIQRIIKIQHFPYL